MPKLTVRPVLLLLTAGLFGLAGCSSSQPGMALPSTGVPTSASAGQTTSTAPAGPSSSAAVGTSSIDPCSLLRVSDLTQYGSFSGPGKENLGGARVCGFQRTRQSASDKELGVSINVRDTQGTSTVNDVGGGKQTGRLNGRPAIEAPAPSQRACLMALAVGDNARVDVSITADSAQEACAVAEKVADVVEPKLPKG
jgi:hypothetical protein